MTRTNRLALGYIAKTLAGAAIIFSLNMPPKAYGSSCNIARDSPDSLRNAKIRPFFEREPKSDVMRRPGKSQLSCRVNGKHVEYYSPEGTNTVPVSLRDGEKMLRSACVQDRAFILTSNRLLSITNVDAAEEGGRTRRAGKMEITPQSKESWVEIDFAAKGVVTWEQSYGACYVLTQDHELTAVMFGEGKEKPETLVYRLPFQAGTAKMVYYSGFLFIGAQGESLIAFSFKGKDETRYLPVTGDSEADFSVRNGRLFYGNGKQEFEIKAKGPGVWDLDLSRNH